jgi:hypothetical protein
MKQVKNEGIWLNANANISTWFSIVDWLIILLIKKAIIDYKSLENLKFHD